MSVFAELFWIWHFADGYMPAANAVFSHFSENAQNSDLRVK